MTMGVVVNGPWPMSQPLQSLQNEFCSNGSPEKSTSSPWLKRIRVLKSLKKKIGIGSRGGDNAPNNLPPLHFHSVHGENIEIRHGGTVARRVTSFCNAVTFSDRPIKLNEKIFLKFLEVCNEWSGVVRFGFTNKDPKNLSSLPPYSIPNLTSQAGFWAGTFKDNSKDAIFNDLKRDVILYYYLNPAGNIHFGVNGEEKGIFLTGVDTRKPLWALIDVYGKTTAIELVDPRGHLNNSRKSLDSNSRGREEIEMTVVQSMSSLTLRSSDNESQNESQSSQRFRHKTQPLSQSHRHLPNSVYYSVRPRLPLPLTSSTPSPRATCSFNSTSRLNIPTEQHQPSYQSTCSTSSSNFNQQQQQQSQTHLNIHQQQPQQQCPPTARIRPVSCSSSALQSPTSSRSKCEESLEKHFGGPENSPQTSSHCRKESQQPPRTSSPIYSSPYPDSSNWSVECGSCGSRPVDTVFYPCGHMCLCYECAFECWTSKEGGRCPICKTPISEVILRTGRP